MSQISPPIRILLVGSVLLAAVWVLFLQPKSGDGGSAPAPAAQAPAVEAGGEAAGTKLGQAVEAANGAAAKTDARNAAVEGAESATAPETAPSTGEAPAAAAKADEPAVDPALEDLPKWLQSSIDKRVVAILFHDNNASDDRRTRAALADSLKGVKSVQGAFVKRAVPISRIARYGGVARGVDVTQSPTLMVIDKQRNASALVGYANVDAINQAILDAILATDNPADSSPVVKVMQTACRNIETTSMISAGDSTTVKDYRADLAAVSGTLGDTLKATPPVRTGAYVKQAKLLRSYVKSEQRIVSSIRGGLPASKQAFVDSKSIRKAQRANDGLAGRAKLELNAIGVTGCN